MNSYNGNDHINIGTGKEITIHGLAEKIKRIVGFEGELVLDRSKPDGTLLKRLDVSKMFSLGWRPQISLNNGIESSLEWYIQQKR